MDKLTYTHPKADEAHKQTHMQKAKRLDRRLNCSVTVEEVLPASKILSAFDFTM